MNKIILLLCTFIIIPLSIFAKFQRKKTSSTTVKLTTSLETMITSSFDLLLSGSMTELMNTTTAEKTIVFDKVITEKMITYTGHWMQPYPSTFSVSVNNKEFLSLNRHGKIDVKEKEFEVPKDNTLRVVYEWALDKFGKRWHHEKKEVTFKVSENRKTLDITFGFDCESRIQIPQAKLLASNQLISKTNT
jgi:hypothetical protein